MMIDVKLFALLAIAVAAVGAYLWLKPKSKGGVSTKYSGIGDQGQYR